MGVSEEKLAAYRRDYQNFRAGKNHGAKGEVSSSVALDLAVEDTALEMAKQQALHAGNVEEDESPNAVKKKSSRKKKRQMAGDLHTAPGQPAFIQISQRP